MKQAKRETRVKIKRLILTPIILKTNKNYFLKTLRDKMIIATKSNLILLYSKATFFLFFFCWSSRAITYILAFRLQFNTSLYEAIRISKCKCHRSRIYFFFLTVSITLTYILLWTTESLT